MFGMSAGQINMNVYVVQVLVICTINLHWSITINKRRAATESCKGTVVWMLGWCNVSKVGFENAYLGLTKVGFENAPDMLNASTGTSIWTDEIGGIGVCFPLHLQAHSPNSSLFWWKVIELKIWFCLSPKNLPVLSGFFWSGVLLSNQISLNIQYNPLTPELQCLR